MSHSSVSKPIVRAVLTAWPSAADEQAAGCSVLGHAHGVEDASHVGWWVVGMHSSSWRTSSTLGWTRTYDVLEVIEHVFSMPSVGGVQAITAANR